MRPARLVFITATGTEVGKTWIGAALLRAAASNGLSVAARKPAQSFDPASSEPLDSAVLANAVGCDEVDVCPVHRWYPTALAPPMAAAELGLPSFAISDLAAELTWPMGEARFDLGIVEGAGGLRSPLADDGDNLDFACALQPDVVVLVTDAGLGTINQVRLNVSALAGRPVVVFLNRFSPADPVHALNRKWLVERDHLTVATTIDELLPLVAG
jgi:dethiobiotin synthetase